MARFYQLSDLNVLEIDHALALLERHYREQQSDEALAHIQQIRETLKPEEAEKRWKRRSIRLVRT